MGGFMGRRMGLDVRRQDKMPARNKKNFSPQRLEQA